MQVYFYNVMMAFVTNYGMVIVAILALMTLIWLIFSYHMKTASPEAKFNMSQNRKGLMKCFGYLIAIVVVAGGILTTTDAKYTYKNEAGPTPQEIRYKQDSYQYEMKSNAKEAGPITLDGAQLPESNESRKARIDKLLDWKDD